MSVEDAKQHIEQIRQAKFGIMPDGTKRPHALESDVRAMLRLLAEDLNAKETHFILELLQNAEDNTYPIGEEPSLSLSVIDSEPTLGGGDGCLCLLNNEVGFTPQQVQSLCSGGQSTKEKSLGYIGEKGIGFKSVFRVTDQPHIFSNGYRFRFQKPQGTDDLGYIVPHWVDFDPPTVPSGFTAIYLPLIKGKRESIEKGLCEILPETILFLTKLRRLQIGSTEFVARDCAEGLVKLSTAKDESLYFVQRQYWSRPEGLFEEKRPAITEREVMVALPLKPARQCLGRVFAFLPTELDTGLPFLVNADFILTSSRDSLLEDRRWNEWLRAKIAPTFVEAFLALLNDPTWRYEAYRCIPIRSDIAAGADYFAPVVDSVLESLRAQPCVLSADGELCLPSQVLFAGALTRRLLADAPLGQHGLRLIDSTLEATPYRNRLGQSDGLGVSVITVVQIFAVCGDCSWLSTRSFDWWEMLFDLLAQSKASVSTIESFPLLLCQDGVCRSLSAGVFLHPEDQPQTAALPADWPPVHFLHATLQARLWQKPQVQDWFSRVGNLQRFSVDAYIIGHLLEWMHQQTGEQAVGRLVEATRFVALSLKRPEDYKDVLRGKMPWLLADQRVLLPEARGDKELVTPECLESDTGWNWVFISPQDRQHFWLLSDTYMDGQPDATRGAIRRLMVCCGATDLPDPASVRHGPSQYDWHPPRWLRDLSKDHPSQNLERKAAALEHWIGKFARLGVGRFTKFMTCGNDGLHYATRGDSLSELGLALRGRPWMCSTKGLVAPTATYVEDPEVREFLGDSVPYTSSNLPRDLLERLGVRLRLSPTSLIEELRRMRDSGSVDAALIVRIYRRLQFETFDKDVFRRDPLIYLTEPSPCWRSAGDTVWKDLGAPFDVDFGFVARTYGEEDLHHFFTKTLGVAEEPPLRRLVEIWETMSVSIPDAVDLAEARLKEIMRRCASAVDQLQAEEWWAEKRSRLAIWTTSRCFARPDSVYAPDDGFAEQVFAGEVTIAWSPKGLSAEKLATLLLAVGCRSFAREIRSTCGFTDETVCIEPTQLLTQASKELLLLWVCQAKDWEKGRGLLESLMKSGEVVVEDLTVKYSVGQPATSVSRSTAAFWSAKESRMLFDVVSTLESRRSAAAKSVAAGLRRTTKDDEDTAYRLLKQTVAEARALVIERKWALPPEAAQWLETLGLQMVVPVEIFGDVAPTSRSVRPRLTAEHGGAPGQAMTGSSPCNSASSSSSAFDPASKPSGKGAEIQDETRMTPNAEIGSASIERTSQSGAGRPADTRSQDQYIASADGAAPEPPQLKSPDEEDAEVHVAAHTRSRPGGVRRTREGRVERTGESAASSPLATISQRRKSEIEDMAVRHALRQFEVRDEFRGFHPIDVRASNFGFDLLVHGPAGKGLRIEIKAHQSEPNVVFITKNEWDESRRTGGKGYRWELWNICNLASRERVKIVRYSNIPDEAIYRESGYWVDLSRCSGVSRD